MMVPGISLNILNHGEVDLKSLSLRRTEICRTLINCFVKVSFRISKRQAVRMFTSGLGKTARKRTANGIREIGEYRTQLLRTLWLSFLATSCLFRATQTCRKLKRTRSGLEIFWIARP